MVSMKLKQFNMIVWHEMCYHVGVLTSWCESRRWIRWRLNTNEPGWRTVLMSQIATRGINDESGNEMRRCTESDEEWERSAGSDQSVSRRNAGLNLCSRIFECWWDESSPIQFKCIHPCSELIFLIYHKWLRTFWMMHKYLQNIWVIKSNYSDFPAIFTSFEKSNDCQMQLKISEIIGC